MNEKEFLLELEKINLFPTKFQLSQLFQYYQFLVIWNEKFNLTRILDQNDCYLKHFYDSLTIVKIKKLHGKVLDVGSGAGFPGIVLKILFPELEVTLLDSNNKKVTFLNEVIKNLNLKNIKAVNKRIEEFEDKNAFDIIVSRAVADMTILSELCLPFVKKNGCFIAMKASCTEELQESEYAIKELGGKIEQIINFNLPINNHQRTLIEIKKIKESNKKYPRNYSQIKKKPLKKKTI